MTRFADPDSAFPGVITIVAPHMDDEALGCGALLAHPGVAARAHIVFVTDGARSPEPPPGHPAPTGLAALREREAREAASEFGVPDGHLTFLGLPDGELAQQPRAVADGLLAAFAGIRPDNVFVPFRRDHHPDHIAVNAAVRDAFAASTLEARVVEYFVYTQWRLLPGGDLRGCVIPKRLVHLAPGVVSVRKRRALERHRTQVTRYYEWQRRPILTQDLIERVCSEPEAFVVARAMDDPVLRPWAAALLPAVQRVEPVLKRWKDRLLG